MVICLMAEHSAHVKFRRANSPALEEWCRDSSGGTLLESCVSHPRIGCVESAEAVRPSTASFGGSGASQRDREALPHRSDLDLRHVESVAQQTSRCHVLRIDFHGGSNSFLAVRG